VTWDFLGVGMASADNLRSSLISAKDFGPGFD